MINFGSLTKKKKVKKRKKIVLESGTWPILKIIYDSTTREAGYARGRKSQLLLVLKLSKSFAFTLNCEED